ncbi:hypothetical protein [Engelhardtia mirabilis]|uniref:Uncharacterized protein n=1 Tax=Engelhardtia mirabilis TaxID=2528011 RepID=A0A518BM05_9BACT|nr:hypothetical protein Pla133_30670 [Planctomycetes bacterium Pla133]QDV02302.1 hypothetical protein Pla86_30660 [Planctomycetes bacterium Pla86]
MLGLVPDALTTAMLIGAGQAPFGGTLGTLSAEGASAAPSIDVPAVGPALIGTNLWFAWIAISGAIPEAVFASPPAPVRFLP